FRRVCTAVDDEPLANLVDRVAKMLGYGPHLDFNHFMTAVARDADRHNVKLTTKRQKLLQTALAEKDESAEKVVKKVHKPGKIEADPLYGKFEERSEKEEG